MPTKKYQRRSAANWEKLIEQFQHSGLSGAQFCRDQKIPYASFSKWRQRLLGSEGPVPTPTQSQSGFVELNSWHETPDRPWRITLRLGNGVELSLSQP